MDNAMRMVLKVPKETVLKQEAKEKRQRERKIVNWPCLLAQAITSGGCGSYSPWGHFLHVGYAWQL
jgi:hypothetical protein